MEITEVRVKLANGLGTRGGDRLQAFCSITLEGIFVVRDLKVIEGAHGLFVAMPSRKLTDRCRHCHRKNPLRQRYCGNCGRWLGEDRACSAGSGRLKLHADIAHPIESGCRSMIERIVLERYELVRQNPALQSVGGEDAEEFDE